MTGFVTQRNPTVRPLGLKSGECAGIEILTLDNGAICKSVHGHLKREPGSINYEIYGTKGSMESERFRPSYAPDGQEAEIQVYREGDKLCVGTLERYHPGQQAIAGEMAKKFSTHGGSDFYPTHFFIERILGDPDGAKYSIDVYQAVDMGICGLLAYRSALSGNMPMRVPDLRKKEEREAWRKDNKCTNPNIAKGADLLPCYPGGDLEYPDSVYEEVRGIWLSGKNAE